MNQNIMPASKMGFGCMRLPLLDESDVASIDIELFKQMVDAFMEAGNTYFDTAFVYHNGASETALREALVKRYPRESFTLATKCLAWAMPDAESAKNCLDVSLERLGTDYVDYYLLHNVGGKRTAKFDEYGMWDFVQREKEAGRIRFAGFSMHDNADTLDQLLTAHPEMDFVQLQVNYLDWDDPHNKASRLMDVARKHGKPVIIMEPGPRRAPVQPAPASGSSAGEGRPRSGPGPVGLPVLLEPAGGALGALGHVESAANARECGQLPQQRPLLPRRAGGAGRGRGRAALPCQRSLHQLQLLREGLPRRRADSEGDGASEPGGHDQRPSVREGPLQLANRRRPCQRLHPVRRLRGHVPPADRHHQPAEAGRREIRVTANTEGGQRRKTKGECARHPPFYPEKWRAQ